MAIALPQSVQKVLTDKAYGHVITFNPSGSPQLTMVWMDVENGKAQFNTADGRIKVRNLRRDPRIIVSIQNRDDPQSYVCLTGRATLTEQGADANIDKLAKRFLGMDKYPWRAPGEKRILAVIDTEKIGGFAPGMKPWA
jgi:PPOX class probable F420-dependent enzyme